MPDADRLRICDRHQQTNDRIRCINHDYISFETSILDAPINDEGTPIDEWILSNGTTIEISDKASPTYAPDTEVTAAELNRRIEEARAFVTELGIDHFDLVSRGSHEGFTRVWVLFDTRLEPQHRVDDALEIHDTLVRAGWIVEQSHCSAETILGVPERGEGDLDLVWTENPVPLGEYNALFRHSDGRVVTLVFSSSASTGLEDAFLDPLAHLEVGVGPTGWPATEAAGVLSTDGDCFTSLS